jgi:hypothetical protein
MFEEALTYPTTGDDSRKSLAIGIVLSLLGVLILPVFVVFGYLLGVLRQGSDDDATLPVYEEWGTLLVDGLKAFLVTLGFFALPTVLLVLSVLAFVVPIGTFTVVEGDASGVSVAADAQIAASDGLGAVAVIALVLGLLLVVLAVTSFLAAFYVLPAGLARFAETDRMGAAFALRSLWPVLTSGTYAVAWLLAFGVSVAAGVLTGIVAPLPVLGFVVGVAVTYYANVVAFRLYGQGYARATPVEDATEPPAGQPAA